MTKREKVIKGLEYCAGTFWKEPCMQCPYVDEETCTYIVMRDALALLKEQNAVEPIRSKDADVWYCGNCDAIVGEETLTMGGIQEVRHNYCPECGRKVKWDATD